MIRAEAFEAVGGFDPTAAAGEEPELCQRLRKAGWSVWRIDAEMTRHDLGMTRFRQWWRRQYRSGYNGLDILTRFPGEDRLFEEPDPVENLGDRLADGGRVRRAPGRPGLAVGRRPDRSPGWSRWSCRSRCSGWRPRSASGSTAPGTALAYGVLTMVAKWADLAGQIGYVRDRRRGGWPV